MGAAGHRLKADGHAVEKSRGNQCRIGNHTIGRHRYIPRQGQKQEVKYQRGDAAGKLPHKGGHPQHAGAGEPLPGGPLPGKGNGILPGQVVEQADRHAYNGRNPRSQRRSHHAHVHGEHEHIVKDNVEKAAAQGSRHGNIGGVIVADEGCKGIVQHKERCKKQHRPQVGLSHTPNLPVRSQKGQYLIRAKHTTQKKHQAGQQGKPAGVGEVVPGLFPACRFFQTVPGGRTDANHGADGKHQSVYRKHQIQSGHAVGAGRQGNKEGICQQIAGDSQHSQNVGKNIAS